MEDQAIRRIITTGYSPSKKSKRDFQKSLKVIPCGVQTLSKMPNKYVEGVYPLFLEYGKGAWAGDGEGNRFIDYPCGLGAILLGHAYPEVNRAIRQRMDDGTLFICPSRLETSLAEKLKEIIPCAEMSRFLKTGSETTSAAIKIARSFTNREHIAFCGYHGWHDWFTINTPKNKGIPQRYAQLTHKFEYNNLQSLETILKGYDVAAVIMEPCVFDEPQNGFLEGVKKLAHKYGALLIFDEVVTGFRFPGFSAQKFFDVIPDLATFGKAMGNGIPMGAICGKKEIMKELEGDCFVSSTFGGDLLGVVASLAVIQTLEYEDVFDRIFNLGSYLQDGYNTIAESLSLDTECRGYPNRTFFTFPTSEHKSLFWQECIQRGVFFGWANFISYSHSERIIDYTLEVVKEALGVLKENWKEPSKSLKGKPATEVFRLITEKK